MEQPKPDNIQSEPAERRSEEIQAHAPTPSADPPPLPDYDFKTQPPPKKPVIIGAIIGGVIGLCNGLFHMTSPTIHWPLYVKAIVCISSAFVPMLVGMMVGAWYRENNK